MSGNIDRSAELARDSARGVVLAARVGYAAKGLVYSIVGALALMFAFGESGGSLTDSKGALSRLAEQPFGQLAMWATAIGLACYALWSAVRAILDPERKGNDRRGLGKRVGYALAALSHGALSVYAGQLALDSSRSSGDGTRTYVAQLMELPFGRVAVAVGGLIAVGFGIHQVVKALRDRIDGELRHANMSERQFRVAHPIERIGVGSRGIVFAVVGFSFVLAALRANPSEAQGIGDALRELATGPFGDVLLALVAAGLFAYGVHQFFVARFARIPAPR